MNLSDIPVNAAAGSNRGLTPFLGPNSNRLFDRHDKDFSVTNLPGSSRLDNGFHGFRDTVIRHHNFKLHLWKKIDRIFAAAVDLRVTLLTPEAFHFAHGHPLNPNLRQGLLNVLHLKGFNDRLDFLHNFRRFRHERLKRKETDQISRPARSTGVRGILPRSRPTPPATIHVPPSESGRVTVPAYHLAISARSFGPIFCPYQRRRRRSAPCTPSLSLPLPTPASRLPIRETSAEVMGGC